jgi:hypothetical protein
MGKTDNTKVTIGVRPGRRARLHPGEGPQVAVDLVEELRAGRLGTSTVTPTSMASSRVDIVA